MFSLVTFRSYIIIRKCLFLNNAVLNNGGAIFLSQAGNISIIECIFYSNTAKNGGAIYYDELCRFLVLIFYLKDYK